MNSTTGLPDLQGKHVLVYSLGIEGRDLASWAMTQGAVVTMSDTRSAAALQAAGAAAPEGVERVAVGQPLLDPDGFDVLAVSQSILRHDDNVVRARELGIPITSQMRLFLQLNPGRVVGITGSSGKTTTTALVGAMAASGGLTHVVGGNIGEALLGRLAEISTDTTVVLEISHTQLQYTDRSPAVGAITNITPNHLDQFSWDEYVGLKRHLLAYQSPADAAVLNRDDEVSRSVPADEGGTRRWVSTSSRVGGDGAWIDAGRVVGRIGGQERALLDVASIRLRGEHNIANVVMAACIGATLGLSPDAMERAVAAFRGVPHRLEVVGTARGVLYVNDSIATSPERTIAALKSFEQPVVLLLGGRDKNLPMEDLAALAAGRCRAVVCFGEASSLFATGMSPSGVEVVEAATFEAAVREATRLARPGDVVLLSPAGTSFDAYPNFEARGAAFRDIVRALPGFGEEVLP